MPDTPATPMSPRDWHVLLALSERKLHGYGIMQAVERDSDGEVSAEVGSLYRVLDRLLNDGLIEEVEEPEGAPEGTPGKRRRYYGLTELGRASLRKEAARMRHALDLARERDLLPERPR